MLTPEILDKTKHNHELKPLDKTVFLVDFKQNGIGSSSCGPQTEPKYSFNDKNIDFSVRIKAIEKDYKPFDLASEQF